MVGRERRREFLTQIPLMMKVQAGRDRDSEEEKNTRMANAVSVIAVQGESYAVCML